MGFLKELNKYLVKYGEIVLNKTEVLAQLVKLKIEIKKRDMEIEKVKIEIGEYVIACFEKKEPVSEEVIKFKIDHMNTFHQGIGDLKVKYENTKNTLWGATGENTGGNNPA